MAILSLRPRAFRSRNAGRDSDTDTVRLDTVRNAIAMALGDARRERDGLLQRMNMYYAQAASILDSSSDYGHRAASDETAIRSAENSAVNARQRVAQLDIQMAKLEALMQQVDGTGGAASESRQAPGASVA